MYFTNRLLYYQKRKKTNIIIYEKSVFVIWKYMPFFSFHLWEKDRSTGELYMPRDDSLFLSRIFALSLFVFLHKQLYTTAVVSSQPTMCIVSDNLS